MSTSPTTAKEPVSPSTSKSDVKSAPQDVKSTTQDDTPEKAVDEKEATPEEKEAEVEVSVILRPSGPSSVSSVFWKSC